MITKEHITADDEAIIIVNAWLNQHHVKVSEPVPYPIIQASEYIIRAWHDGELFQSRDEGVVLSKTAKAGDVSVSKTYAAGQDGQAMGQNEQIALALITPYVSQMAGAFSVNRG